MNKQQLKHIVKHQAVLSHFIDTTYPDKHFIKLSMVNALIESELSDDVKNSSDYQRQSFIRKLNACAETVRTIQQSGRHPDLYVDAYAMELVSVCVVARRDHMALIDACINDNSIDILYHNVAHQG